MRCLLLTADVIHAKRAIPEELEGVVDLTAEAPLVHHGFFRRLTAEAVVLSAALAQTHRVDLLHLLHLPFQTAVGTARLRSGIQYLPSKQCGIQRGDVASTVDAIYNPYKAGACVQVLLY